MTRRSTSFDLLPDSAYVRVVDLVGAPDLGIAGVVPFSRATLWRKVRDGTFPSPAKLSERVTAWQVGDVRKWLAQFRSPSAGPRRPRAKLGGP